MPAPDAVKWSLDPSITFLNHGSFGATPRAVLEDQTAWRMRLEAEPVLFLDRELPGLLAEARLALGDVLGGDEDDLAFVSNATTGINAVLRSLRFSPGDELLATDHECNATLNALREVAERDRARVVIARVPFSVRSPAEVIDAVVGATTSRTRLALVSHVTSPTAAIFPIRDLVRELQGRGVDVLVDAAHA
ncbi:MAG TPA: aminotransferase class V-fold PLP-dependent enzyme, partial [Candidatus Acidoferrum sp.]|nr:aminotransferase class V-fold PLP-dependent enzyme [Candidatus Acidoferrum sp.]